MVRAALDMVSACASVLATTNSTPSRPAVIILLTALPPAPPTPNTVIRGFISRRSERSAMSAPQLHGKTDRYTALTYTPYDLPPLGAAPKWRTRLRGAIRRLIAR